MSSLLHPRQGHLILPTPRPKGRVWAGTPRAPQGGGRPLDPRFGRALHSPVLVQDRIATLLIIRYTGNSGRQTDGPLGGDEMGEATT